MAAAAKSMGKKKSFGPGDFRSNFRRFNELVELIIVSKGNHPQMAARFRLVNYYNLPRSTRKKKA